MSSEDTGELMGALALAQGEFPPIEKTKTGKVKGESKGTGKAYEFEYKYADIADVLSAVRPVLSKHSLAVLQLTETDEVNVMWVRTRLSHKSGQWIDSLYPVCSINADHQKMGGALTYARRYSLTSLIGVAAEDDLDGQSGSAGTVDTHARSKDKWREEYSAAEAAIRTAPDKATLKSVWESIAWDKAPRDWIAPLTAEKNARLVELNKPKASDDPFGFDKLEQQGEAA